MQEALAGQATIVTVNNRLARHLHRRFNLEQAASGLAAWPTPDILPWGAWLERLWQQSLVASGVAGSSALLGEQQSRFVWESVIREDVRGDPFLSRQTVVRLALHSWRSCCDWEIPADTLFETAATFDSRKFARWAARYRQHCLEHQWIDQWMLPALLVEDILSGQLKPPAELLFAGFDSWPPQRQRLARQFEAAGSQVGMILGNDYSDISAASHAQSIAFDSDQQELDAAARWARLHIENAPNANVAVIIPDLAQRAAQVRRSFLNILAAGWQSARRSTSDNGHEAENVSSVGVSPVNISYGWPLFDTGLVHSALTALKLVRGRMDYRDLGLLLRSRYLDGGSVERSERAALDVWLRRRIGPEIDLESVMKQAVKRAPGFAAILKKTATFRDGAKRSQLPAEWVGLLSEFLSSIGWPGDDTLSSEEYQASEAWHRLLEQFASCDQVLGNISIQQACDLLGSMAHEQIFQPEGPDQGIQVLGILEATGQQFDAVWVCGMNSDVWPPAAKPDPLILLSLQRRLQMPGASQQEARARANAQVVSLLVGASEARVSWVRWKEDEPADPSPLIERLQTVEPAALTISTAETWRQRLSGSCRIEWLEAAADVPPKLSATEHARGGAALLAEQAVCPARAFIQRRLAGEELEVPALGIDAGTRGKIVHHALECLYQRTEDRAALLQLDAGQRRQQLAEVIDHTLSKYLPLGQPFLARLAEFEKVRLLQLLDQLLTLELARDPFEVVATEQNSVVTVEPLKLNIRLDRVDELSGGAKLVLDYKTGQVTLAGWKGARLSEPQLPLYATVGRTSAVAFVQINDSGIRMMGVGDEGVNIAGIREVPKFLKGGPPDWPALVEYWRQSLQVVAKEFATGDFRIDRRDLKLADGPYAMLTRIHDFDIAEPGAVAVETRGGVDGSHS